MEFRSFGRTGLKISAIGFGCWEIGGTYGRIDESLFQRAVARASARSGGKLSKLTWRKSTPFLLVTAR